MVWMKPSQEKKLREYIKNLKKKVSDWGAVLEPTDQQPKKTVSGWALVEAFHLLSDERSLLDAKTEYYPKFKKEALEIKIELDRLLQVIKHKFEIGREQLETTDPEGGKRS